MNDGTYTNKLVIDLESKALSAAGGSSETQIWDPGQFCRSLPERLLQKLKDFGIASSLNISGQKSLIYAILNASGNPDILREPGGLGLQQKTVESWITGSSFPERGNMYKACAALGLDRDQTSETFLKAFLTRPFNLKDRDEFVYAFFAGKQEGPGSGWYIRGTRFLRDFSQANAENAARITHTDKLLGDLAGLTEDRLAEYLTENADSFVVENDYFTARETMREYAGIAWKYACLRDQLQRSCPSIGLSPLKADTLVNVITDYFPRTFDNGTRLDGLPYEAARNFPSGQVLGFSLSDEADKIALLTSDRIAKLLKLLVFYTFFSQKKLDDSQEAALVKSIFDLSGAKLFSPSPAQQVALYSLFFDGYEQSIEKAAIRYHEFVNLVNSELQRSGFVQLYVGNPYDRLLMHCATQRDPLSTFRIIIRDAVRPTHGEE